jgi:hypothetical protein
MGFPFCPSIGQTVTVGEASGSVEGQLVAISLTIQVPGKEAKVFPIQALKSARFTFPSFEDSARHLADAGEARHCQSCYIALLYAVEFLAIGFTVQAFQARADLIRRGIVNFLANDFPSAGYALLPQAEGIVTQLLHEDGLLKRTEGFPEWTQQHPDPIYQGKSCTNLKSAIEGAAAAGDLTRLKHLRKWLGDDQVQAIHKLRNNLLHGSALETSEHEVASVILLLQGAHHGVTEGIGVS